MTKLGELYHPTGKALETAQQVLQMDKPMAVNIAWGCTNQCVDCYVPYIKKGEIRYPKTEPHKLVEQQLKSGLKPEGVFISFDTDPLLQQQNLLNTFKLASLLKQHDIPVAILSKMGIAPLTGIRHGVTLKSHEESFRREFEPNALPIDSRIKPLRVVHNDGGYTWVSDEPHPCPAIYKQNDREFWETINFVDFIIFGMWNYNSLATTEESRIYYVDAVSNFRDFCEDYGIRYWIKNDTLKFIGKEEK